jgi:hypothetical protein
MATGYDFVLFIVILNFNKLKQRVVPIVATAIYDDNDTSVGLTQTILFQNQGRTSAYMITVPTIFLCEPVDIIIPLSRRARGRMVP